jgi:hypothetical protein
VKILEAADPAEGEYAGLLQNIFGARAACARRAPLRRRAPRESRRNKDEAARAASLTAGLLLDYCLKKSGIEAPKSSSARRGSPSFGGRLVFEPVAQRGIRRLRRIGRPGGGGHPARGQGIRKDRRTRLHTPPSAPFSPGQADPSALHPALGLKESWLKATGATAEQMFAAEFVSAADCRARRLPLPAVASGSKAMCWRSASKETTLLIQPAAARKS